MSTFDVSTQTLGTRANIDEDTEVVRSDANVSASSPAGGAGLAPAVARFTGVDEEVAAASSRENLVAFSDMVADRRLADNMQRDRERERQRQGYTVNVLGTDLSGVALAIGALAAAVALAGGE